MSRAGRKRKLARRTPKGAILNSERPFTEYRRPPGYCRDLREFLTGDPNARCDWHDPLEHFAKRGMDRTQKAAALRYRRDGRLMLALDEAPEWPKDDVLGRLQPLGAIGGYMDTPEGVKSDAERSWKEATNTLRTPMQRSFVYRVCVLMLPQFTHSTDIEGAETYWRLLLAPNLSPFLNGLDMLVRFYGYDKKAAPSVWIAENVECA